MARTRSAVACSAALPCGRRAVLFAAALGAAGASEGVLVPRAHAMDSTGASGDVDAFAAAAEGTSVRGGKVLVLGANGRVGAAVSAALLERGTSVRGVRAPVFAAMPEARSATRARDMHAPS